MIKSLKILIELKISFYSGINNDNIILNWTTILGYKYQIQSSADLIDWYNIGEEIIELVQI